MRTLISNFLQTRRLFHEYFKPCTSNVVTYFQSREFTKFSNNCQKHFTDNKNVEGQSHNLLNSITGTHKSFEDKDAEIIFDIHEKQEAINLQKLEINEKHYDPYEGVNLERGINGVFELEELVLLLQKDNVKDIFVASVPSEMSYVDYIVIVTGKSYNHMKTLASFIRKVYKMKKHKTDMLLTIDGEKCKDWIALDLGNIVLHIFSHSTRLLYDLETLWSVGPDYDEKCRSTTEDIMEQYNTFLSGLEPIENNSNN